MAAIDFLLLLSSVLLFGLPAIIDHLRRHHPNESDLVGQVANATHHILQHMVRNFTRLFFVFIMHLSKIDAVDVCHCHGGSNGLGIHHCRCDGGEMVSRLLSLAFEEYLLAR